MLKIPRFVIQDQIFNFASLEVIQTNLILVHAFENEELEKDLLKKICQSINILSYDIKIVDIKNGESSIDEEDSILNPKNFFSESYNFIFEFNHKNTTTSVDLLNGITHLKTFSLNQLLTNKDQKMNLWNILKTLKPDQH